jgi:predicted lipoprotein with Yx(FWY)xxD motif
MIRRLTLIGSVVIALTLLSAPALAAGHPTLQLRKTSLGKILVGSNGFTLYAFTLDSRNHDACAKISGCLGAWPAVVSSAPSIGPGVKASLVGTIPFGRGKRQVTYAGHPLYTYVGDSSPGQTTYVNILQFRGRWPALNASGGEVK